MRFSRVAVFYSRSSVFAFLFSAMTSTASYREVLHVVIPLVLSNMAFTVMQFTDRVLLARHSSEAIQAALPAGIVAFTLVAFFASIAAYSGTFVAQYYGAKDDNACRRACAAGIHLSILFIPVYLLLLPLSYWLLDIAGHPQALQALERPYAFWNIVGGPFLATQWVLGGYLSGTGRATICSIVSVVGCGLNIFLDVLFIFGPAGCPSFGIPGTFAAVLRIPEMGVEGAAIATMLSCIFSCILCAFFVALAPQNRNAPLRDWLVPDFSLIARIVRFGLPTGIQMFFDCGAFAVFVLLTGRLDALSLAASNIVLSINNLAFSILNGLSNAAAILTGQYQGARRPELARSAGYRCLHLGWIYMTIIAAIFIGFTRELLEIFQSPGAPYTVDELYHLGRTLICCIIVWGFFDTMNIVLIGALKGAGDTLFIMLALCLGSWLLWIPSEMLCLNVWNGGIVDAWIVQTIYIILLSFVFLYRWHRGKWQEIRVIDP